MSQPLPIGKYEWISQSDIEKNFNSKESILDLKDDADKGYVFEVDLNYPSELHDKHNDFPFCAEKRGKPGITKNDKLLLTFYDKEKYVVHYKMLKEILKHGLKLKKVHRVLQFDQCVWMKPYIDLNTEQRTKTKSKFEQKFFKVIAFFSCISSG